MPASTRPLAAALFALTLSASVGAQQSFSYHGRCDASAAVALDATHFVVANDEENHLQVFERGRAEALQGIDLGAFLGASRRDEADIEGAAAIGSRVYWITSHGRNSKGQDKPSRRRLFATDIGPGQPPTLTPVGTPYRELLQDLSEAPALQRYRLAEAAQRPAEADGGLNIEGLAATADGQLLIGFRNPVPGGRALVVPLQNPSEILQGQRARLGTPVELDLGGRGIRSFDRIGAEYWIVAGPTADRGDFRLYRWSGRASDAPRAVEGVALGDLRPEALFTMVALAPVALELLSDDGGVLINGVECKSLPPAQQRFRALTVPLSGARG